MEHNSYNRGGYRGGRSNRRGYGGQDGGNGGRGNGGGYGYGDGGVITYPRNTPSPNPNEHFFGLSFIFIFCSVWNVSAMSLIISDSV
nr:hypothetical protein [Tanacetum cinerariifolium]